MTANSAVLVTVVLSGLTAAAPRQPAQMVRIIGTDYAFQIPKHIRAGKTIFTFERDPAARRAESSAATGAMGAIDAMRAVGIRYVTVQVRDCGAEYRRFMSMGVWEGAPPGGHHRKGSLRFKALTPQPTSVELQIHLTGEDVPRSFLWNLKGASNGN